MALQGEGHSKTAWALTMKELAQPPDTNLNPRPAAPSHVAGTVTVGRREHPRALGSERGPFIELGREAPSSPPASRHFTAREGDCGAHFLVWHMRNTAQHLVHIRGPMNSSCLSFPTTNPPGAGGVSRLLSSLLGVPSAERNVQARQSLETPRVCRTSWKRSTVQDLGPQAPGCS